MIRGPAVCAGWKVGYREGHESGGAVGGSVPVSVASIAGPGVNAQPVCNEIEIGVGIIPVRIVATASVDHLLGAVVSGIGPVWSNVDCRAKGRVAPGDEICGDFVSGVVTLVTGLWGGASVLGRRAEINQEILAAEGSDHCRREEDEEKSQGARGYSGFHVAEGE